MATEHSVWTREQVLEMPFIITGTVKLANHKSMDTE